MIKYSPSPVNEFIEVKMQAPISHSYKKIIKPYNEEISHLNFMSSERVVGGLGSRTIDHEEQRSSEK